MPASFANFSAQPPKRVVVKLGTGVLTSGIGQLDTGRIAHVCAQIAALRAGGTEVIVVSSGAVGLGMGILGLTKRPSLLAQKQACAGIGQSLLMQTWQQGFDPYGAHVAQVLLTHEDLRARARHLGVKASLEALIAYGTIPVVNENDTVSAAEIRFGDNDTLSAMVAGLTHADYLVILSTAPGLIDMQGTGEIVPTVNRITPQIEAMAGGTTSATAVGGMVSKISAAKLAVKSGCGVFIADGSVENVLPRIFSGHNPGTYFVPSGLPLEARKRWLAYYQRPTGRVIIDAKAAAALCDKGRSLLAVGVTGSEGLFAVGDIIDVTNPAGEVIARGKTRFANVDVPRISGLNTDELKNLFPQRRRLEVIHRNDLVLL
ncbi:glutamate 5-kinase [Actomonas aquatica]|uniref:Glutamate 5-kinase n=1 Tax=Actomonas aquatica TaxID=2866162 RepID=A0ABZ1CCQ3_9BACT|nr:glutamate 5-kinase [Opitutus sp. WL0086]WRQ89441.1 glutamate 5-kinase [Opitutus sp. WL0086]